MKYAIIFSSRTGNTKLLAETVKASLPEDSCTYFGEIPEEVPEADLIFMGFWTDKGTCDSNAAKFMEKLSKKNVFLFGTAGFGGRKEYFEEILARAKDNLPDDCTLSGTFMCQGRMPASVRERYVKLEAEGKMPNAKMMIENFDKALSHPDENDLKELKEALKAKLQ